MSIERTILMVHREVEPGNSGEPLGSVIIEDGQHGDWKCQANRFSDNQTQTCTEYDDALAFIVNG